jgi:hypothetical protein
VVIHVVQRMREGLPKRDELRQSDIGCGKQVSLLNRAGRPV